jgi:hypothetical protein
MLNNLTCFCNSVIFRDASFFGLNVRLTVVLNLRGMWLYVRPLRISSKKCLRSKLRRGSLYLLNVFLSQVNIFEFLNLFSWFPSPSPHLPG